ncbi:hypothetical protein WG622_02955 [Cognatishimia sp. D5M38]|uniref:Uncharacterized protein n=1 Tax=Cognatishimia coralii TaxID=3083254 RepID=A0ABU8QCQ0_9RHOB
MRCASPFAVLRFNLAYPHRTTGKAKRPAAMLTAKTFKTKTSTKKLDSAAMSASDSITLVHGCDRSAPCPGGAMFCKINTKPCIHLLSHHEIAAEILYEALSASIKIDQLLQKKVKL